MNDPQRTCILRNACRFKIERWRFYVVVLWTLCVFGLHRCSVNASKTNSIYFNVTEGLPIGTYVGNIANQPYDVVLHIQPQDDLILDSVSKNITTRIVLDREKISGYVIDLLNHNPFQVTGIFINVSDINDNIPTFPVSVYDFEFYEGNPVLAHVRAIDDDLGSYAVQNYSIVSGNTDNMFVLIEYLDSAGRLRAKIELQPGKQLDREQRDLFSLNVSATDGGTPPQTGFGLVNITVLDLNDNDPVFNPKYYTANITENSKAFTSIVEVYATDKDIGRYGKVLYSVIHDSSSDPDGYFTLLTTEKGEIVNVAILDREKQDRFSLRVRAHNPGSLGYHKHDIAFVTINVLDENDNPPEVTYTFYLDDAFQVYEDASPGTKVARVRVSDKDAGKNGQIESVTIQGGNGHLSIAYDAVNDVHIISLAKELDREKQPTFPVHIYAKDRGQPQQTTQDGFIFNVGDINDNHPKFDQDVFTAAVSENATIGTSVLVARATDKDIGSNAKLVYNISYSPQAAPYKSWFQINQATGEIRTSARLDREKFPRLEFLVTVTDSGVPALGANCTVIVNITDANDNNPVFTEAVYFSTVNENSANNTSVVQVMANDIDSGINGMVLYSLETQPRSVPFSIDPNTGLVSSSGLIDFEAQSLYLVNVVASDGGGRFDKSILNISVVDENDNYPVINPTTYNVSVFENLTINDAIVTVLAKDNDSGIFSQVNFAFSNGNNDGIFFISSSSGVITLIKPLDRETKDFHRLEVQVMDGGGLKSKNSAVVEVTVLDVNDEPPAFEPSAYKFTIIENSDINSLLGSVYASSKDLGTNADIYYSISGGDMHRVFTINSTGTIFTRSNIDHERSPEMLLTIQAKDGGVPPLYGFANVSVTVIDINDNAPSFESSVIDVNVLEDTKVGEVFYNVTAKDPDSGLFGRVRYTLLFNPNSTFQVNASTGALTLTHSIDFEGPRHYMIKVLAEDGGSPPLNTTATFRITVVDVNDHTPVFSNSSYSARVDELTPAGTDILNVTATDADTGNNAWISYSFQSGVDTSMFGLRSNGWLYITRKLDREQQDVYRFKVVATDKGRIPKSSTADVVIHVDDVNDHNPEFTQQSYIFSVDENQPNRTLVGQVPASDKDAGANARISYTFEPPSVEFVIDHNTGIIRTNQVLNREQRSSYTLMVKARDHGASPRTDYASVTVTVQDLNDNAPTFKKPFYEKAVPEDIPLGSSVLTVEASDPDVGSNGMISYFSASNPSVFTIDAKTGVITTTARLDREKHERYTLSIGAKDHGNPNQSHVVFVTIHVLDVNDNPPRFVNNSIFVNIPEKQAIGTVVTTVTARDKDTGNNGKVRYTIDQGNGGKVFEINATSGVITLRKQLDFEKKSKYQLRIEARDQGQNSQRSYLYVTVYVLDSNDNRPTFEMNPVTVQLREGVPPNSNVTTIKAHDYDSGQNSWIRYSIDSQSPGPPKFKVDPSTGVVQTIGRIDREAVDEYTLNIRATDQAFTESERLSSTLTIFIIVSDVNDNKPTIVSPNETFVMEDEGFRYPVITITAIDDDLGSNGEVTYKIEHDGNGESFKKFALNADTGLLELLGTLDHETTPKYVLNISVTDKGTPPRSSFQLLTVFVVDVNDNGPEFNQSLFLGNVSENQPVGTPVMTVSAYDLDSGENGALTYSIPRGNLNHKFAINGSSGVLYTNSTLDREEKDEYTLTVYATDNVYPRRVGTCTVKIKVLDVNDHRPVFIPSRLNLTVLEHTAPFDFHTLRALDSDIGQNGRLRYIIQRGNEDAKFSVGEFTGVLSTTGQLDREIKSRYDLVIEARNVVVPFYNSSIHVTIFVGDKNDNSPKFVNTSYSLNIRELTKIGTSILRVKATDGDSGKNGEITFSLSTEALGIFRIDSKSGTIYTLQEFDYYTKNVYNFLCRATDKGVAPRETSVGVTVSIIDENNHAPVFEKIPYEATIASGSSVTQNTLVTAHAKDKDSSSITHMTYRLANSSNRFFQLESNSGNVRVKPGVSNIPDGAYVLNIIADDGGNLTGRGILEIIVGSAAVNRPKFVNSTPVFVSLPENSPKGREVARVLANPSNDVVYSIVDGNSGNAFLINAQNGIITVQNPAYLDFERLRYFSLRIIVSRKSQPSRNDYLTLQVNLTDVNDNNPVFYPANISVQLSEDDALQSSSFTSRTVANLSTTDKDSGKNQEVTYKIIFGNVDRKFVIDAQRGVLTTNGILDREKHPVYDLVVNATDKGTPSRSSLSHVVVNIVDVNDNIPTFSGPYSVNVNEDLRVGSLVKRVAATDKDKHPNLMYSFGNDKTSYDVFRIDQLTGEITLLESLDYERNTSYELNVTCSDGRYKSHTTVTVNVKDVNDNAPKFLESSYQATLSEETAQGTSILKVSAEDKDDGSNRELRYAFVTSLDVFRINATSGVIYTAKKIETSDRESLYFVVVSAIDRGVPQQRAFVTVQIRINRKPMFREPAYKKSIAEDAPPGTTVLTVSAADDSGMNVAKISYKFKFGNSEGLFRIGLRSGIIEVSKFGLDYESEKNYLMGVEARDESTNKSVVVEVNITITDVNDNSPVFDPTEYVKEVYENVSIGTTLVRVNATDKDSGANGRLVFSILSGNDKQSFRINSRTGEIVTITSLDYESIKEHRLSIQASDEGLKPKSKPASVRIKIRDVNDNKPEFHIPHPEDVGVEENSPVGTFFYELNAKDRDSGENNVVMYSIIGGSGQGLFIIESDSGRLSTNATFNYEARNLYWLLVKAVDKGKPPLDNTVNLTVNIKSVDEFEPTFERSSYEFEEVPGNAKIGYVVGQVVASDEDDGEDGRLRYSFDFVSLDVFAINETTGIIFVNKSLSEVNNKRRKRRSVEETDDVSIGSRRFRREIDVTKVKLRVQVDSGKPNSFKGLASVEFGIDFACAECANTEQRGDGDDEGISKNTYIIIGLAILVVVILIAFIVMAAIILRKKKKKRSRQHPRLRYDGSFDEITVYSAPNGNINHVDSSLENVSTPRGVSQEGSPLNGPSDSPACGTDSSDTPNSASSGRGSSEGVDFEDGRHPVIVNGDIGSLHSENYVKTVVGPDSGIQQDSDQVSQLTISDASSMMQGEGLAIDKHSDKIEKLLARLGSQESLHVFGEEGGGEADGGVDVSNLLYAKLAEVDADEDESIIDGMRPFVEEGHDHPSYGGSLSSIVGSREELTGSYNWDYLLDWGPQFQPLADVFLEIGKMKDDAHPKKTVSLSLPSSRDSRNPPTGLVTTDMLSSVSSLPRSPISPPSTRYTSPAFSPNFTPAITPLVTRSPSVSPLDTGASTPAFSPASGTTPKSGSRPSSMHVPVLHLRRDSHDGSNSDLTHSPSISDNESNLEIDV